VRWDFFCRSRCLFPGPVHNAGNLNQRNPIPGSNGSAPDSSAKNLPARNIAFVTSRVNGPNSRPFFEMMILSIVGSSRRRLWYVSDCERVRRLNRDSTQPAGLVNSSFQAKPMPALRPRNLPPQWVVSCRPGKPRLTADPLEYARCRAP